MQTIPQGKADHRYKNAIGLLKQAMVLSNIQGLQTNEEVKHRFPNSNICVIAE
jgi:hypothetical protein